MSWRRLMIVLIGLAGATLQTAHGAVEAGGEWYVGQKVVCVNNRFLDVADAPELTEGSVYTIKEILPRRRGFIGLAVLETPARDKYLAFDERRFRPVKTIAAAGGTKPI